jgi:hypothetical protein
MNTRKEIHNNNITTLATLATTLTTSATTSATTAPRFETTITSTT